MLEQPKTICAGKIHPKKDAIEFPLARFIDGRVSFTRRDREFRELLQADLDLIANKSIFRYE